VLADLSPKCWGRNDLGQLDLGHQQDRGDGPDEMGDNLPPVDLGSDGGVFAFGDARFAGSLPALGITPDKPVVGLVPDPDGYGYWLVAADGGVFAFGAPFVGSLPGLGTTNLDAPIVGMTAYADGYLQVASDGGVFNFSSLPFSGSLGDATYNPDIVAITPAWRPR